MAALWEAVRRLFPPLKVRTRLFGMMAVLLVYGLVVSLVIQLEHLPNIEWGAESAVVNGLGLSFLIAFRTNHAYDRWWEARKLWGQLINETRNLCLKIRTLANVDAADRQSVAGLIAAFGDVLKNHLRRRAGCDEPPAPRSIEQYAGPRAGPDRRSDLRVRGGLASAGTDRRLDAALAGRPGQKSYGYLWRLRAHPQHAALLVVPRALRHAIAIYLAVAPFYLMEDTGIAGFPMFVLAAYFLLGIELVAEEIEEPFGAGGDNLPLERYCATIAQSVHQIMAPTSGIAREEFTKASPSGSPAGDLE